MNERLTYTNLPKAYCPNDTLKKWKEFGGSCRWCYDYDYELWYDCKWKFFFEWLTEACEREKDLADAKRLISIFKRLWQP